MVNVPQQDGVGTWDRRSWKLKAIEHPVLPSGTLGSPWFPLRPIVLPLGRVGQTWGQAVRALIHIWPTASLCNIQQWMVWGTPPGPQMESSRLGIAPCYRTMVMSFCSLLDLGQGLGRKECHRLGDSVLESALQRVQLLGRCSHTGELLSARTSGSQCYWGQPSSSALTGC